MPHSTLGRTPDVIVDLSEKDYQRKSSIGDFLRQFKAAAAIRNKSVEPKAPCRIFDFIAHQVESKPDAPAIQYESDTPITYAELGNIVEHVAYTLRARYGEVVPICMDVSVRMIGTILGILKSGAAYLILDPMGSTARNNVIVDDCHAKVVVVDEKYAHLFSQSIFIETSLSQQSTQGSNTPSDFGAETDTNDPAYLIYTSGSTGTPKGVIVTHAATTHGVANFSLRGRSRFLLFYNPIFSAAQRTILATLAKGACLCLAGREKLATHLFETVEEMRVDALGITPSALSLVSPLDRPSCLKTIVTVGEPLSEQAVTDWAEQVELRVSYGLSECAFLNFSRQLHVRDNPRLLGAPTDTTRALVLELGGFKPLAAEEVGELCLTGPQVAAGYFERPEQTAASFFKNFSEGNTLFRTGDSAVCHQDGTFEILGRIDNQIKVNGQRLEPGEVTATLSKDPSIEAVAVVSAKIKGKDCLVAAVVPRRGIEWSSLVSSLRERAQASLASYMTPSFWLCMNSLPMNTNKKLDFAQIRRVAQNTRVGDMIGQAIYTTEDSRFPRNAPELALRDACSKVLEMEASAINLSQSFISLGGTSIDAIRVVRELRTGGFKAELSGIIRARRLLDIDIDQSETIDVPVSEQDPARFSLIGDEGAKLEFQKDGGIEDAYMATPLQQSLIASTLRGNEEYLYHRTYDVRHLDLVKLKLAFRAAFLGSEILRTTFMNSSIGLVQVVRNDFKLPWTQTSMSVADYKSKDKQRGVQLHEPFVRFTVLDKQFLVVSMHHSLFDFWSHHFIYEDAAKLYNGLEPVERPPFRRLIGYLQQQDPEPANIFWKTYLQNSEPCILNHSVPLKSSTRSHYLPLQVKEATRSLGVTSSALIYTAWAILLARHTGESDTVFATTLAGREAMLDGIYNLDGPTLTVVPQRGIANPKMSIAAAISQSNEQFWKVLEHSQHGMKRALTAGGQRDTALFDTLVNILVKDNTEQQYADQIFQATGPKPSWQTEWTSLDVEEDDHGFFLRLTSRMPERRVEFVLEQLSTILYSILNTADAPIESIDILGATEKQWLLSTRRPLQMQHGKLHTRFEDMVTKYPHTIAIQWQRLESISYLQLESLSNQMAYFLMLMGVKPGDMVPLLLNKSPTMVIAMLAILKIGATYVPISPENPAKRNWFIVRQIKANLLLTESVHRNHFAPPEQQINSVVLDHVDLSILPTHRPNIEFSPQEVAYIIYTSGSTGEPKGVMIQHNAISAAVDSIIEFEMGIHASSKMLQYSNYVFDASVYDVFVALGSGKTLCMAPTDRLLSDLPGVINEMEVEQVLLVPTVARLLDPKSVPSLRVLTVGGEAVTADVIDTWFDGHTILGAYGPTETSVVASMRHIDSLTDKAPRNIGPPLPTVKSYILETEGSRMVPWGAVGEICFSGPQLSRGYMEKAEQTAAAFVQNILEEGTTVYRTGDLGRWLPNEDLECLGRKDHQVKIHGYRIELGEIEEAMLSSSCVKDAIAIVAELNGKPQLVAFVVFTTSAGGETSLLDSLPEDLELFKQSLNGLAHYMSPKYLFPLQAMPKLPSGKCNRKELKAMLNSMTAEEYSKFSLSTFPNTGEFVAPETRKEVTLQKAWADVLKLEQAGIGLKDQFHALGGDSISAINLTSELRKKGYLLSVGDALDSSDLREMAGHLKEEAPSQARQQKLFEPPPQLHEMLHLAGLQDDQIDHLYPCPPGQAEFLSGGTREEQFWVLMAVRQLDASIDLSRWLQSAKQLSETNEILRTTFTQCDEKWYGAVLKDATPVVDMMEVHSQEAKSKILEEVWNSRFVFGRPFLRYVIMRMWDGTCEVAIKMDHGLYDGTLLRVFDSHFRALQRFQPVPDFTNFREFAAHVYSADEKRALDFWTQPDHRPTAFQYPQATKPSITAVEALTTPDLNLDKLAKSTSQTPSIIFQAAFQIWLALRTSTLDVSFDYLYTGRSIDLPNPQSINGTCANFLPLRAQIYPQQFMKEYIVGTNKAFWHATEHDTLRIQDIYHASGLDRRESGNTALFLFQPFEPPAAAASPDEDVRWLVMAKSQVTMPQPYAVVFEVVRLKVGWKLKFAYDDRVFDKEGANKAVLQLRDIVAGLGEIAADAKMDDVLKRLERIVPSS